MKWNLIQMRGQVKLKS